MQFAIFDFGTVIKEATRLSGMAVAGERTREPLIKIYEHMLAAEEALFASQGRRGGGSWQHLKPDTVRRKGSSIILVQTGALRDSLTKPGAQFQILRIGNTELEFGTSRPDAAVHQTGTRDGRIPARPFMRFTPFDINRWITIINEHLLRPHRGY
jgi:phage gpG-like protein